VGEAVLALRQATLAFDTPLMEVRGPIGARVWEQAALHRLALMSLLSSCQRRVVPQLGPLHVPTLLLGCWEALWLPGICFLAQQIYFHMCR